MKRTYIKFRCSIYEKKLLKKRAERAGISLSEYCRSSAFGNSVIERLTEAGCPVRVMVAPVVPALTDHEAEAILDRAAGAGAVGANWIMLRLPLEVAPLFREWLEEHFPDRARRVLGRVRELHGGQDYDHAWGKRLTGEGLFAELFAQRFEIAAARAGLQRELTPLRTDLFRCPARAGDQLSLF